MKYEDLGNNNLLVQFDSESEKERFIRYFTESITVSSKQVEQMGISRQLLKYHVGLGQVRTVPYGKQRRYMLEDIKKLASNKNVYKSIRMWYNIINRRRINLWN